MIRLTVALLAAATVFGACSDSTQPEVDPFEVELSLDVVSSGFSSTEDRWECLFDLRAEGIGGGPGDFAEWLDGEGEIGFVDGSTQTLVLSTLDVVNAFGSETIGPGEVQGDRFVAIDPDRELATIDYTFRWVIDGRVSSQSVGDSC